MIYQTFQHFILHCCCCCWDFFLFLLPVATIPLSQILIQLSSSDLGIFFLHSFKLNVHLFFGSINSKVHSSSVILSLRLCVWGSGFFHFLKKKNSIKRFVEKLEGWKSNNCIRYNLLVAYYSIAECSIRTNFPITQTHWCIHFLSFHSWLHIRAIKIYFYFNRMYVYE